MSLPARCFFLFGMLFQSSIAVGGIYMLNYVPPAQKENYMTLAYATDGVIGGGATFLAGVLLQSLEEQPIVAPGRAAGRLRGAVRGAARSSS